MASTKGEGTVFSIYLPQFTNTESPPIDSTNLQSSGTRLLGGSETILLVEDDESVRALARTVLEHYGYEVIEAANGYAALQALIEQRDRVHLLITDIVMPGMSGAALVEQVHKLTPGIPVLFISGYIGESATREQLVNTQANFLQKPFEPLAFAIKVREVLDQHSITATMLSND